MSLLKGKYLLLCGLAVSVPALAFSQVSGIGQLGCSATPYSGAAWSSGTAANTTQTLLTGVAAWAAVVQLDQTSTLTAGAVTFQESYDGINFISVPVAQVLNPSSLAQLTNPYTLVASTNQTFLIPLFGATQLQLKLTTAITGSGTVTPYTTAVCSPWLGTLNSSGYMQTTFAGSLPAGSNTIGAVTQASGPWTNNITQWDSTALGAPSNYGTSPGAVPVPGVNAYVTNSPSVAQSGTWTVQPGNTANTTAWLVTGSGGTFPATESGTWTVQPGNTANTTPWLVNNNDACQVNTRSTVNINQTASAQLISGTSGKQTYICSIDIVAGAATNVALVEGTGTTCGTSTTGMAGGNTAATGWNLAANGGLVKGQGGFWVYKTATAADNVCILQSAANQLSGSIQYVQQ